MWPTPAGIDQIWAACPSSIQSEVQRGYLGMGHPGNQSSLWHAWLGSKTGKWGDNCTRRSTCGGTCWRRRPSHCAMAALTKEGSVRWHASGGSQPPKAEDGGQRIVGSFAPNRAAMAPIAPTYGAPPLGTRQRTQIPLHRLEEPGQGARPSMYLLASPLPPRDGLHRGVLTVAVNETAYVHVNLHSPTETTNTEGGRPMRMEPTHDEILPVLCLRKSHISNNAGASEKCGRSYAS